MTLPRGTGRPASAIARRKPAIRLAIVVIGRSSSSTMTDRAPREIACVVAR